MISAESDSESTPTRQKSGLSRRKKLLFAAGTVFILFLALEIACRVLIRPDDVLVRQEHEQIIKSLGLPALNDTMEFDERLFWRLKRELADVRVQGTIRGKPIDFTVNTRDHLRCRKTPLAKSRYRILALGDSCTFGLGVNDDQTWPAQLQRRLHDAGIPADVLNAGVPGYTAFQGRRLLELRGPEWKPDLVLVNYGFNDVDSWSSRSDRETARFLEQSRWDAGLTRSRLYAVMKGLLHRDDTSQNKKSRGQPRLSRLEFYNELDTIRIYCAKRGIEVCFLVWPYASQIKNRNPARLGYQSAVLYLCQQEQVRAIDLVGQFLQARPPLFVDHVHGNPAGCRVAADAVFEIIQANVRSGRHGAVMPARRRLAFASAKPGFNRSAARK